MTNDRAKGRTDHCSLPTAPWAGYNPGCMGAIHQLVAGFNRGDAISNEARVLRGILRGWGFMSEIFCDPRCIHPDLRREAQPMGGLPGLVGAGDVVLLHLSVGADANDLFERLPSRKAILYHNMTPEGYFRLLQPATAALLRRGLEQMRHMAGVAEVNLAVSRYNAEELERAGYRDVGVLPIVMDFGQLSAPPDPTVLRAYDDARTTVLFVGRCAPNKAIEDLVRLFACYQRHLRPDSRLIHVGSFTGMEAYYGTVRILARNLRLHDVQFMGSVTDAELRAFYRVADLFLCASEHEGFCIPLLEAMAFDVPVLAYAAAAVPETMDGAGVLFREKEPGPVAEMMHRLTTDTALRDAVIAGQRRRMERYRALDLAGALREALAPVL
jgi:L-malate glycosyltransferase